MKKSTLRLTALIGVLGFGCALALPGLTPYKIDFKNDARQGATMSKVIVTHALGTSSTQLSGNCDGASLSPNASCFVVATPSATAAATYNVTFEYTVVNPAPIKNQTCDLTYKTTTDATSGTFGVFGISPSTSTAKGVVFKSEYCRDL
jgi:hypothetical protein